MEQENQSYACFTPSFECNWNVNGKNALVEKPPGQHTRITIQQGCTALTGGWRNVISVIYRPSKYHLLSLSQYGTWYNHVIIWVVIAQTNITFPDITCYRLGQHGTLYTWYIIAPEQISRYLLSFGSVWYMGRDL